MNKKEFKDYVVHDQLAELEVVERAMFGGYGLYLEGHFFAILAAGSIYFKTNQQTRQKYIAYGEGPFQASQKQTLKNYYRVPICILENSAALTEWAKESARLTQLADDI